MNDITDVLKCYKHLYDDNLKPFCYITTVVDCLFLRPLDKISDRCDHNGLDLNIDKCKIVSFSRKKNHLLLILRLEIRF